jgi:hypothetical protein
MDQYRSNTEVSQDANFVSEHLNYKLSILDRIIPLELFLNHFISYRSYDFYFPIPIPIS